MHFEFATASRMAASSSDKPVLISTSTVGRTPTDRPRTTRQI